MTTPSVVARQREYYLNNREKLLEYRHDHYQNNRENVLRKSRERVRVNREWLADIKRASGCVDCGIDDPDVLEFDHRDPNQKSFNIAGSTGVGSSREKILAEVAKCDVRCANCHRKRTKLMKHWSRKTTNS